MKTHSTNYTNTFISVAEDCPVSKAEIPPQKGDEKTVANLQFDMVYDNPYKYTSDELIFDIHAKRKGIGKAELNAEQETFFSKGQPCLRSSPLAKRYGWGIHHDDKSRVAIYPIESKEYKQLSTDKSTAQTKAMRSSRK